MLEDILEVLPDKIKKEIATVGSKTSINEIRLRVSRKIIINISKTEILLNHIVELNDLLEILVKVSKNSLYAIQNDINNGFVTIKGGHRIGVCGEVVIQDGKIKNIKNISGMNIRVARQIIGCADKLLSKVIQDGIYHNTLIISPPGAGKTTILRDAIRQLSNGIPYLDYLGQSIGVVDERGEIAAISNGNINLDVGARTDVMSNCPKSLGIEMLIRSMGVSIIATDEIGIDKDIDAIKLAATSGVKLIFTMHGTSIKDLIRKTKFKNLILEGYFENIVILSLVNGPGTLETIKNVNEIKWEEYINDYI